MLKTYKYLQSLTPAIFMLNNQHQFPMSIFAFCQTVQYSIAVCCGYLSLLSVSRVSASSDVPLNVKVKVQTVADVPLVCTFQISVVSRILTTSDLCIHVVNYTSIYKRILLKSKIHHTGMWLEAAWLPRCLCYRPTIFFRHLPVITLSYRQEIFGVSLKMFLF